MLVLLMLDQMNPILTFRPNKPTIFHLRLNQS